MSSPWASLVAEILLQRTRAEQVAPVYEAFLARWPTPEDLAAASLRTVERVVGSLGLRWRIPLMIEMAKAVTERGGVPEHPDALCGLPGVGPYAAAAFLSLHRGKRAVIVDANVVRWLGRMFDFPTDAETRRKRWLITLADRLTPARLHRDYNYAVLDLGMQVCAARPKCSVCPLAADCRFRATASR